MPAIVKKLAVFATTDGLILQPHGGANPHGSLRIDFKTKSVESLGKVEPETLKQTPRLESHGIIGERLLLSRHVTSVEC
jgi:hypothetical protein